MAYLKQALIYHPHPDDFFPTLILSKAAESAAYDRDGLSGGRFKYRESDSATLKLALHSLLTRIRLRLQFTVW